MTTKEKLIPVDKKRCQAEIRDGSFMTLGPRSWVRCENKPTFIIKEPKRADGKARGSMSCCDSCRPYCEQNVPGATYTPLN